MWWKLYACVALMASGTIFSAASPANAGASCSRLDSLVVVTWNVEWFGHPWYPPENDALQIINVADVLRDLGAHVYALQEVASAAAFQQLLSLLGHPYAGVLSDSQASQRLAFVYDSEVLRVEWSDDHELTAHAHSFAGRLPLVLRARPNIWSQDRAWTFITVHMKAFFDADSRARRTAAGSALKEYTDPLALKSPVVVLGDFNDDFPHSLAGGPSPYGAILLDTARYYVPTTELSGTDAFTFCADSDCTSGSVIDHIVTSRGLAHHVRRVERVDEVLHEVASFVATTSDHLPVRVAFHFFDSPPGGEESPPSASITMLPPHPNPIQSSVIVPIELSASVTLEVKAIDLIGRSRAILPASSFEAGSHNLRLSTDELNAGPWIICASTRSERSCQVVSKIRAR